MYMQLRIINRAISLPTPPRVNLYMARLIFSGMAYIAVTKYTDHYNGSLSFSHNEQFFFLTVYLKTHLLNISSPNRCNLPLKLLAFILKSEFTI